MRRYVAVFIIVVMGLLGISLPTPVKGRDKEFKPCGCELACVCSMSAYPGQDCCAPEHCKCPKPKNPSAKQLTAYERSHAWIDSTFSTDRCCRR